MSESAPPELCKGLQSTLRACQKLFGDDASAVRDEFVFEIDKKTRTLRNKKRATWEQMCRRAGQHHYWHGKTMDALMEELSDWLKLPWRATRKAKTKRKQLENDDVVPSWAKRLMDTQVHFNKTISAALHARPQQQALQDASAEDRRALVEEAAGAAADRVRCDIQSSFIDDHKDDWEAEVKEEMRERVEDALKEELKDEMGDEATQEMKEEIKDELKEELQEEIEDSIKDIIENIMNDDDNDYVWDSGEDWQSNLKNAMNKLKGAERTKKRRRQRR